MPTAEKDNTPMPIKQAKMRDQIAEARAAIDQYNALRNWVLNYGAFLKREQQLGHALNLAGLVDAFEQKGRELLPAYDALTRFNEIWYAQHGAANDRKAMRAATKRRVKGTPTQAEFLAKLHIGRQHGMSIAEIDAWYETNRPRVEALLAQKQESQLPNTTLPPVNSSSDTIVRSTKEHISTIQPDSQVAQPEDLQNLFQDSGRLGLDTTGDQ